MAKQGRDTGRAGEGGSDVEPETQTGSQFRENHFVWLWEGWTDGGGEVEMAFLLLSTSISQCFPPTIPRDITSLPLQVIILPFAVIYVAKSSQFCTERSFSSLRSQASPHGPLEQTNIINRSYSHTNRILTTNAEGKKSKTDLSLMFFLGHRMCKVTSMFSFMYNYTWASTLSIKSAQNWPNRNNSVQRQTDVPG